MRKYTRTLPSKIDIDEAYKMADNIADIDTDADIIHERTKSINIYMAESFNYQFGFQTKRVNEKQQWLQLLYLRHTTFC